MSKQNIAPTRGEGTSTSRTLANTTKTVKKWQGTLEDCWVMPLSSASEQLWNIAESIKIIRQIASHAFNAESSTLNQLQALTKVLEYQAHDFAVYLDCAQEQARDEHIPALLAALEGK